MRDRLVLAARRLQGGDITEDAAQWDIFRFNQFHKNGTQSLPLAKLRHVFMSPNWRRAVD